MTAYDVLDEATIAATPAKVVQALLDEAAGRSQWWQPSLRMRQRGDTPPPRSARSWISPSTGAPGAPQRWATVRFSGRVTAFEPERRLVLEYFDGDFRGTAEWTLNPAGPGRTHIVVRFMADPHGGLRLRARFADVPSINSSVMQEGFPHDRAARRRG
jgi:uncharacterized protein YndB with AHSA1/START domain